MKEMRNHRQGQGKFSVAEAPKQNDVCLPNIEVIKMDHQLNKSPSIREQLVKMGTTQPKWQAKYNKAGAIVQFIVSIGKRVVVGLEEGKITDYQDAKECNCFEIKELQTTHLLIDHN